MDRERKTRSQQKALILLLPLALLAAALIALNSSVLELSTELRSLLDAAVRMIMPGIFVVATAFLVNSRHRALQLGTIIFDYLLLLLILGSISHTAMLNPSVCVISACFAILVLRQGGDNIDNTFWSAHPHTKLALQTLLAVILPVAIFVALINIVRQIESFVVYTFNESLGRSLLSMIFSPIYLILQTLGFQNIVTDTALLRYQDDMMLNALINSIILTNFLALPSLLIARSFFSGRSMRLFLTMLAMCIVMASSIGPCISLSLVLLFIMLPGTYSMLMIASLLFYFFSYYLGAPSLVRAALLYRPDLMLPSAFDLLRLPEVKFLCGLGIVLPIIMISLALFVKKERLMQLGQRRSFNKRGINLKDSPSPDLTVIGLLRALGGLSNIVSTLQQGSAITVKVSDGSRLQHALLTALSSRKPHYDKLNHSCTVELGELSDVVFARLTQLTADNAQLPESEAGSSFKIQPMPHARGSRRRNRLLRPLRL